MEAVRRASRGMMGATEASASSSQDSPADSLPRRESEVVDEEQQPLIRRDSRPVGLDFDEVRQEAIRNAAMESGWFTWVLVFFAFCIFVFWFYVNVRSWYVLFVYYDTPCDQPLNDWLLVKIFLDVLSSSAQQRQRTGDPPRAVTWLILACQNAWLVLGFHWSGECHSCQSTNPELYNWVKFLVVFGTAVTLFLMLLPVLFYMGVILVVHLIGTGRIKNYRAARDDTLGLLEKIEYSADLFADKADPNDNRPSGDCCCCCDDFNAESAIVRTPCEHYYHQACLAEWLKLAKSCPICRCDLDVATEDKAASTPEDVLDSAVDRGIASDMVTSGVLEGTSDSRHSASTSSSSGARSSALRLAADESV